MIYIIDIEIDIDIDSVLIYDTSIYTKQNYT